MATAAEWVEVVEQIRADGDLWQSPAIVRLWELAETDGKSFLRSFESVLGRDKLVDLIHDFLVTRVEKLIAAESPKMLFKKAIRNYARSWLRRGSAVVADAPDGGPNEPSIGPDETSELLCRLQATLEQLSARDQEIVIAVCMFDEDRESFQSTHGVSRTNVDKIVSRFRKALNAEGAP